ncbi:MAG: TonB-dependent receptor [Leeuwenhoekiella sp.]
MNNPNRLRVLSASFIFIFLITLSAQAQDEDNLGTEVVNVVKPYTPEIGDAFKVKATPQLNDSVNTAKKKVTYGIFSVPVASTFTPAKGKAATVERAKRVKLYDNYVTLGFGSYTSALAEFYSNFEVSRSDNFGIYLNHNSSQGGIKDIALDDKFYDTNLNLNYSSRNRDVNWRTDLDLKHQLYNWYGVDDFTASSPETLDRIDPQHSFYGAEVSGSLDLQDSFFKGGRASLGYFGDSFSSSEIRAIVAPTLEFPISDENITLGLKLDYVNGSFDRNYDNSQDISYSHLNISANPSLQILRDDLTLRLGVSAAVNLDTENSETNIYLYPRVTASYRVVDEYFIAYGGIEGELQQNSYEDYVTENPFLSPTLLIRPTDQQYDGYVGMKGKLVNSVSYNLRGSYTSQNNKALFKNNPRFDDSNGSLGNEGYQYGNSFDVVYDDVKTFSAFGELNFDVNSNFKMRVNAEYFSYNTSNEQEAWNLPDYKASLFADYQISEQWFAGANLFLVGERKDETYTTGPMITEFRNPVTLDSYFDLNAHVGYRVNEQLSAFGRINNILDNGYDKWVNFPVQGLQVMAGATYKFDF